MKINLGTTIFSPAHTLVTAESHEGEWAVLEIELYYDSACTKCMSDDNALESFPPSAQMEIIAALNAWDHERRQALHRLEIQRKWPALDELDQALIDMYSAGVS